MSLGDNAVLGVALGSSQAAGYVTPEGNITPWLNLRTVSKKKDC